MVQPFRLHAPVMLPCDEACSVWRDAIVDVDETGRIGYCGPAANAPTLPIGVVSKKCSGILMPGLINAHGHSPMTVLRGMGGDRALLPWLNEVIWPAEGHLTAEDVHAGMLLGCVEMLRSGVTTSAEMYFFGEHMVDAVLSAGSRMVLTEGILAVPGWSRLGSWQSMTDRISRWIDADGLRFGRGERIELGYGPHSAYALPEEALTVIAGEAKQRDALVNIHLAETLQEDQVQRDRYGSVPLMLNAMGILNGRLLAAHAIHLSDVDIELLAANQVGVAHCPGSNAKLASGMGRLTDLLAAGVAVGLGTDGPASNDDLDLWEEIQLASLFARLSTQNAAALTAAQALLLATRGGASALRRNDIGSLITGNWADIVHVDVDAPAFAAGLDVPDTHLVANLVWAAGSRQVHDVWVAGEQVINSHEPTMVDRAQAQAKVRTVTHKLLSLERVN